MIGYIKGTLLSYTDSICIIETAGGVGYEVCVTPSTVSTLLLQEMPVALYIATVVREDALLLFGFTNSATKQLFITLTSISKVGAKTALSILELFTVEELYAVVSQNNAIKLSSVPGIGKKTAQHIILELQYKLRSIVPTTVEIGTQGITSPSLYIEAKEALLSLGYDENRVHAVLYDAIREDSSMELASLIKKALHELAS